MVVLLLYLTTNFKLVDKRESEKSVVVAVQRDIEKSFANIAPQPISSTIADTNQEENTFFTIEDPRQNYLDIYAGFKNEIKPALNIIDLKNWDSPLFNNIDVLEKEAVQAFAESKYDKANNIIKKLSQLAKNTIVRSQNAFGESMEKAENALQELHYEEAKLAIENALIHDPGSLKAKVLAQEIEYIPQILELEEAIRATQVENNTSKELQYIEALLNLNPSRTELRQRAATLRAQGLNARYSRHIKKAYHAIDTRDLLTAKTEISKAKELIPSRKENGQVTTAIAELESQIRFELRSASAEKAIAMDDWENASKELLLAINERPSDKTVTDLLNTAKQILALIQDMKILLAKPYRLSNELVKTKATISTIKAESLLNQSPSLKALSKELNSAITAVNTPIEVKIVSDGQTAISLRGIGTIGTVTFKIIELKPGPYMFEGKRNGYKSKIVEVIVPMDKPYYQLRVVADERI